MKSKALLAAMVGAMTWSAALPAMSHHATSTFYSEDEFEMSGKIVEVIWANPHGVIVLQDEDGEYWVGEMAAIVGLAQQGLGPDQLPVGLEIDVVALPSRDGSHRMHINAISVDDEFIYGSPDV